MVGKRDAARFAAMAKSIYTTQQKRLSQLLKAGRKKTGLTQFELADRLGHYRAFISRYERGERRLDVLEFLDVAEALKLDPAEVIAKVRA